MRRLLAVLLLVGCGGFTIDVQGATDDTLIYQALLFEGQCLDADQLGERTVVTRVNLPRGGTDDGLGVGKLDQVTYAIAVVGRDEMCRVRAFGCTEFEPGPGDRTTVAVTSTEIGSGCPGGEVCVSQACEVLAGDAGMNDAAIDADAPPTDVGTDTGPQPDPCVVEGAGVACVTDRDCAPPFSTCDGVVCAPPPSLSCETVAVELPLAGVEIVDVAIAQYLEMGEDDEVEVWAVSSGMLYAGRMESEMSAGTLGLREFSLSRGGIIAVQSWGDRHLVRTDDHGIFEYGRPPYLAGGDLSWSGQLPYCGSTNSGVPDAVLFGSRDPITPPTTAFVADMFNWPPLGEPGCPGPDLAFDQVLTAVDSSFTAFADTTANPIAEIVPTTTSILALHQRDDGVSLWNAQPMEMPVVTPTIPTELVSEVAPGWAAQSTVYRLVTSNGGALQLRSVTCATATCNVGEPTEIARADPSRLMLVELARNGRVLLVLRDEVLDAMFLSDGGVGIDQPGELLATVRLSGDEQIVDFDAFFDRDANAFYVVGLDDDGAPHLYRLSVP